MRILTGDITEMKTDAIVNAASPDLTPCEGICSAIFRAADTAALTEACKKIGHCRIGKAVVTPSCGLPCKYIIHVAGAGWYSGRSNEKQLFADCYKSALLKAVTYRCKSVALPLMFSGSFNIPRAEALRIVFRIIKNTEKECRNLEVSLVLYKKSIYNLALKIFEESEKEVLRYEEY